MVSAVYILHWPDTEMDYLRCELLLHRSYHNDVPDAHRVVDRFSARYLRLQPHQRTPFMCHQGINYIHVWGANDIVLLAVARANVNAMLTVSLLAQMYLLLTHYYHQRQHEEKADLGTLDREFVVDNHTLVYELLDECVDYGLVQVTDFNILKEYIKMEVNYLRLHLDADAYALLSDSDDAALPTVRKKKHELAKRNVRSTRNQPIKADVVNQASDLINSSIVRTQALAISWRPKGIYYLKNEIYIDIVEACDFLYDLEACLVKMNRVYGVCNVRSYLSGMPECKLGLNEKYISQVDYDGDYDEEEEDTLARPDNQLQPDTQPADDDTQPAGGEPADRDTQPADVQKKRYKVPITNVQFHQCIELSRVYKENLIFFTPPDDEFQLLSYRVEQLKRKNKKPLVMLDPTYRVVAAEKKLQLMCTLSTTFKKNLHCHNLVVRLPIHPRMFPLDNAGDDSFRFRCELGDVRYKVDTSELIWAIPQLPGSKKIVRMMAEVDLALVSHISAESLQSMLYHQPGEVHASGPEDSPVSELDKYYGVNGVSSSLFAQVQLEVNTLGDNLVSRNEISVEFEIPMLAYSGLRITYLRVDEDTMKYTCFPWVRYVTKAVGDSAPGHNKLQEARYRFKMGPSNYDLV